MIHNKISNLAEDNVVRTALQNKQAYVEVTYHTSFGTTSDVTASIKFFAPKIHLWSENSATSPARTPGKLVSNESASSEQYLQPIKIKSKKLLQ